MCILIIELIWVAKYGKMGEKPPFLGIFGGWYRYQTVWYRYHIGYGRLVPVPVPNALFWTSVRILAITWSFLIRFELFKWLVNLDFKDHKTPGNRYLQILTICGP